MRKTSQVREITSAETNASTRNYSGALKMIAEMLMDLRNLEALRLLSDSKFKSANEELSKEILEAVRG